MYFGVMGKHRITGESDKLETIEAELKEITWNRIVQVIWAVAEKMMGADKLMENLKQQ